MDLLINLYLSVKNQSIVKQNHFGRWAKIRLFNLLYCIRYSQSGGLTTKATKALGDACCCLLNRFFPPLSLSLSNTLTSTHTHLWAHTHTYLRILNENTLIHTHTHVLFSSTCDSVKRGAKNLKRRKQFIKDHSIVRIFIKKLPWESNLKFLCWWV